jgi:hypothetical protein
MQTTLYCQPDCGYYVAGVSDGVSATAHGQIINSTEQFISGNSTPLATCYCVTLVAILFFTWLWRATHLWHQNDLAYHQRLITIAKIEADATDESANDLAPAE